jgi:peptidyl-prolyl cis-trans isomerase D
MAVIGKIRERSTLLLIIIGGAMVAFVLGDFFSGRVTTVNNQYVGKVYGEDINLVDYEKRVESQKQSMASIGQPVSSQAEQQIRNQVWNSMVQEKILYTEMNKLGLRLGQDEFDDIRFGENVRPEFSSDENFKNPETGTFDAQLVQNYFAFLKERYPLFYEVQVNRIVNERLYEKYNNLVKKGVYTNTLEAKDEYYRQTQKVTINYIAKTYDSMADSLVAVTDKDLKAYFDKHKDEDRFEREATADVIFVGFDVAPTADDEEATRESVADLIDDFKVAANDSLFVLKYGASRNANASPFKTQEHPDLEAQVFAAQVGDIVGPYKSGDRWCIAKVQKLEDEPQATARHILLANNKGDSMDKLKSRADSIKKVIQSKKNFDEMVTKFSDDPGSAATGGKYENFNREMMVPEFSAAAFDKPVGSLNVVETTYGVHLVEPLSRRTVPLVYVLEVDANIEPSSQTYNAAYDMANEFSIQAGSAEKFRALAEERQLKVEEGKGITRQAANLPGITQSSDAVRWAHNIELTKVGQVSEPFEFGRKVVVLALEKRTAQGRATFEDAKEEIRADVVREKKAALFKTELEGKDMNQLMVDLGLTVQVGSNLTEKRPNLLGGTPEPYVVGYAFTLPEGGVSPPLEGERGVFVISVLSKTTAEPREEYMMYADELGESRKAIYGTYSTGLYKSLKEFADVKDDRSNIY